MLAKNYHYRYEVVIACGTVEHTRYPHCTHCFCREGYRYPVGNGDSVCEQIEFMKRQVTQALDQTYDKQSVTEEKVVAALAPFIKELFKNMKLAVITESGYKEKFTYAPGKGDFLFDLSAFRKVGLPPGKVHDTTVFNYQGKSYDMVEHFPEYWYNQWTLQESAL